MRSSLLAALACCNLATAADPDALHSADCSAALASLQAQEDRLRDTTSEDGAARARWQALRETAARRCLGGDGSLASPSQHGLRTPIAVSPIGMAPGIAPRPAAAAAPAGRPSTPPITVTSCDATGCFISDGSRLSRAGAGLIGPRGLCTLQGPFVQCP